MPHVVLNGKVEIRKVFHSIHPLALKNQRMILRTMKKYIDSEETAILIESIAGTSNSLLHFLTLVSTRKDGLVVRLYPYPQVEKNSSS